MDNSVNWGHTTTLRCFAMIGEAYISHLIRLANLNVTTVGNILKKPAVNLRNLRDYGLGVGAYCKFMGIEDELDVRNNRTLFPYLFYDKYSPTLPSNMSDQTIARMLHNSNVNGAVLRVCPLCFSQDIETNGYGIWRIRHQLPVTYYCSLHNQALIDVSMAWLRLPSYFDLKNYNNKKNLLFSLLADEDWYIFSISSIPESRLERIAVIQKWLREALRGKTEIEKFSAKIRNALPNDLRISDVYKFPTIEHGVHSLLYSSECFISNEVLALLSVQYKAAI